MADRQPRINIIFDGGNSLVKIIGFGEALERQELVIPHAFVEDIGGLRFNAVMLRNKGQSKNPDPNWLSLEDRYFVVGESAESEGLVIRKTGSAKYSRDYYGVLFVSSLLRLLPDGHDNIHVFASFPSGEHAYIDDLTDSVIGKWYVGAVTGDTVKYHVRSVQVFDEPLGGYTNVVADPNGVAYRDSPLARGSTLVVDVGGKISSVLRILDGGRIQYATAKSVDVGIQDVMNIFVPSLKQSFHELRGLRSFNEGTLRNALRTGKYMFKGNTLDCSLEVQLATTAILNRLRTFYDNDFEGGANDAQILVTGGGGGALFDMLKTAFEHQRFFHADKLDQMQWANVRGGERLCRAAIALQGRIQHAKK